METVKTLTLLTICVTSIALADDFKTMDGKEYKDATVSRVEPDGIVVKTKSGISKLYFVELPKEVQQRFHYDPQTATAYSAQQAARYEVYQKQQEVARYGQENADAQNRANVGQQQAANARAQVEQDNELSTSATTGVERGQPTPRGVGMGQPTQTTVHNRG